MDADERRSEEQPQREPDPPWFGCLRRYARGKRHDMAAIRKSIAKARKRDAP